MRWITKGGRPPAAPPPVVNRIGVYSGVYMCVYIGVCIGVYIAICVCIYVHGYAHHSMGEKNVPMLWWGGAI